MEEWDVTHAGRLTSLLAGGLPGEQLHVDDVARACWGSGEATVLALPDGAGAVAVRLGRRSGEPAGGVLALAVEGSARGRGLGRRLVDAAVAWSLDHGAGTVVAGGLPPWFLWPGVDSRWQAALATLAAAGFETTGQVRNLSCSTQLTAEIPAGLRVTAAQDGSPEAAGAVRLAEEGFPATAWAEEAGRAAVFGTLHAAVDRAGEVVGFACHSVNRSGWFGPTAVAEHRRGEGTGAALLAASLGDLRRRGHRTAEICWVGPEEFYARVAGARVSRVFQSLMLRRNPPG